MENHSIRELITAYLNKAFFMQVATSHNNAPWVCTVHFSYDDALSLYWISSKNTRHSKELSDNSSVAGTIVLPHKPDDDVQGVQFEGIGKQMTDPSKAREALTIYAKRFNMPESSIEDIITGANGHVCYTIQPRRFVLFDQIHFPNNPRNVYELP